MALSAKQKHRHWPLALFLITFTALTGCRGDSNLSSLFPGGSTQSSNVTEQTSVPPADDHAELPGQPPTGNAAGDPVLPGNPVEDVAGQPHVPETVEDPVFIERPTLQWDSPLTREDGSKLYPGEISGYKVYFRLRHQKNFRAIYLDGPDANQLKLDDFGTGAYEFAVSTLDSAGLESRRSEPVPVDLI